MPRERILEGKTVKLRAGCGNIFITVNFSKAGKPTEVFVRLGKTGGCSSSQTEAIGRLITLLLRKGCGIEDITKHLKGISCHNPMGLGKNKVSSCADAVGKALEELLGGDKQEDNKEEIKQEIHNNMGGCPECGSSVIYEILWLI